MEKTLTKTQRQCLQAINSSTEKWLTAAGIAKSLWPDSHMHTKSSNQGNGACHGKAAWLCGGAYGRKLEKLGYTRHCPMPSRDMARDYSGQWGYRITPLGIKMLEADEAEESRTVR